MECPDLSIQEMKVKQCSDGRIKKEYLLPEVIDREMVSAMKEAGEIYILDYLPEPVYTIVRGSLYNVRGVVGKKKIEVWYTPENLQDSEENLLTIYKSVIASRHTR